MYNGQQQLMCECCGKLQDISEFDSVEHSSVDFDFCMKATAAGLKIFVDPEASMGHIGENPIITKETFLTQLKQNASNKNHNDGVSSNGENNS